MLEMDKFLRRRDEITVSKKGVMFREFLILMVHRLIVILIKWNIYLNEEAVNRIKSLLNFTEFTTWQFNEAQWTWDKFDMHKFSKKDFKGQGKRLNGTTFREMIESNPLSWAMTREII